MILWLTENGGYSTAMKAALFPHLRRAKLNEGKIFFQSLYNKAPLLKAVEKKKMPDKFCIKQCLKVLDEEIKALRPKIIVIQDDNTLRCIVGKKYALGTVRGSVYYHSGIPVIVLDRFNSLNHHDYSAFILQLDLEKVSRYYHDKKQHEPPFDYRLCRTVDEVAFYAAEAANATMVSSDTETAGGFITCITFTYDTRNGKLVSFVVPFFDPFSENGAYWQKEHDEIRVRKILRELNAAPVTKVFQNGTYDCAYEILEGMPPVNYLIDTQNLMHCIWVELPKKLHNIASYFVDCYVYWKDENKGVKEDGFGKNKDDVERYWRYCGLDGYYTYLGAVRLLERICQLPYAIKDYSVEFPLSVGPCLFASFVGLKVDQQRHSKLVREQKIEALKGEEDLKRLSGDKDFNVGSTFHNAWLLYDVLGAKKTRIQRKGGKLGLRSTDEKVLRLMKEQLNPFVNNAIERILRAKKPRGWLSKYGDFFSLTYGRTGRFLSWHNAAATETFRLNSGESQFWCGTNGQNLQPYTQEIFVADDDYVIVDCDYSASDDWFIAYEAQDEKKIEVLHTKDTHSYHASVFFKLDYNKVVAGKKKNEDWVVNAITGVRQISKKFNHGKNFRMGAEMTYNLMGRDMAVATAKLIGYKNADGLTDKELIGMCQDIGDMYDHKQRGMYRRLKPWQDEIVFDLKANKKLATNPFGITRFFFGDADDHAVQRQLSAYFGQSGTSGNINRAINSIFYSGLVDGRQILFVLQVHDSLKFLVHKTQLHRVAEIKSIMEEPIQLKGREFFVPVNVECGLTDGKKMIPWRPDITYEEICAHEHEVYDKKFPKGNDALLTELEAINFESSSDVELAFGPEELDTQLEASSEETESVFEDA